MHMIPCNTCPMKGDCDVRDAKRAAVKGAGLTSIKFRCEKLAAAFKPGDGVLATLPYVAVGESIEGEIETITKTVPAYVMRWAGRKVLIYVPYDDAESDWWLHPASGGDMEYAHVITVRPDRLALTSPNVRPCLHCGTPEGFPIQVDWICRTVYEDRPGGYMEAFEMACEFEK